MRFDRKIKYLDYFENGERVRGGGFIKLETADTLFRLELTVKGVRGAKEFSPEVILCGNGKEETWNKILLEDGQGELRQECHVDSEFGGTGIKCRELTGIRIPLGEGKEISCRWEQAGAFDIPVAKESAREKNAESPEKHAGRKQREAKKAEEDSSKVQSIDRQSGDAAVLTDNTARQPESTGSQNREARSQSGESSRSQNREVRSQSGESGRSRSREVRSQSEESSGRHSRDSVRQPEAVPLLDDKWLQLCAIYPHIKPFQDQREYLSIRPEDFVLLSANSYKAAGNSFMLHGYYNYRHLILTREERRGEILYYVGVPGNYYDREKQVAVMFGFESFECAQEPAQSSDFGYYMMRVQI